MNGAESLVATLATNGVELCFTNPGTSEMHFVAALDRIAGPRCVLGLFEGVVTGAADGYYRMAGKPAATLLHLGPGLGNGLANLHNAKKARSGIVNIVGDHARNHVRMESPLKSDIEGIARTVSHWVKTSASARDVAGDGAQAIAATRDGAVGRIATLVLPADTAWSEGSEAAQAPAREPLRAPDVDAVRGAAKTLKTLGERALLLVGAAGVSERAAALAAAIARKTGCRVMAEFYSPRTPGGRGRTRIERLPYAVDAARRQAQGRRVPGAGWCERADLVLCLSRQAESTQAAGMQHAGAGRRARRRSRRVAGARRRTRRRVRRRSASRRAGGDRRVARRHHAGCRCDRPRAGRRCCPSRRWWSTKP